MLLAVTNLEGFSHIFLLYHFHKAKECQLLVKPFLTEQAQGIFAVRAPNRPNAIGFSIVRLLGISEAKEGIVLDLLGVDMLDETPLLDIKPYVLDFDYFPDASQGWYAKRDHKNAVSDSRFTEK